MIPDSRRQSSQSQNSNEAISEKKKKKRIPLEFDQLTLVYPLLQRASVAIERRA